jgi:hypothetical protein
VLHSSRFPVTLLFADKAAIDRSFDAAKSSSHQAALRTTLHSSSTQQAKRNTPKNGPDRNGSSDNSGAHNLRVSESHPDCCDNCQQVVFSGTYALTQPAIATVLTAGRARFLAFIVHGNYYMKSGLLPWNMEAQPSETSAAICSATQSHIPEVSNPQYRLQLLSPT